MARWTIRILFALAWSLAFIALGSQDALAQVGGLTSPFQNQEALIAYSGIERLKDVSSNGRVVKLAILDNGFRGWNEQVGKTLPIGTQFHEGPIAVDTQTEESHGLFMAQMATSILSRANQVSYELHLFSAFGYSNLASAVDKVVREKFDVVLYAQVWEYGGNGDGRGFINEIVNRATSRGILWINAAGNFRNATYRAPIETSSDSWAKLPGPNDSVRVRCNKTARNETCRIRAVLSWNDFKDDVKAGTDKDLDFLLTDDALNVVMGSSLKQMTSFPEGTPGASLYPREIIEAEVKPGLYYLRAKIRSENISASRDELRILTSGDFIDQLDVTGDETLLAPADNPFVIAVGASDSEKSSISRSTNLPMVLLNSEVVLHNGETYMGSSNSASIAAALAVVHRAANPQLDRASLIGLLRHPGNHRPNDRPPVTRPPSGGDSSHVGYGLPLEVLGFGPTTPGCFSLARLPDTRAYAVQHILQNGGVSVVTTIGYKIFVAFDPIRLVPPPQSRFQRSDMVVVGPNGFSLLPRSNQSWLAPGSYEVVQTPHGQTICSIVR